MAFFDKYPYTDFHELNLDWIIREIRKLHKEMDEFTAINEIKYGGDWDITKQYEAFTLVNDNNMGYISVKPVPSGVSIDRLEYWKPVADYSTLISGLITLVTQLNQKTFGSVSDRRVIFLSDSYGTVNQPSYIQKIKARMGFDDDHFLIDAYGGRSFARPTTTFLEAITADAAVVNPDEITDIVVCGGMNDAKFIAGGGTQADLFTAITNFVDYCKATFKNANIYLGFIGAIRFDTNNTTATNLDLYQAMLQYRKAASIGVKYLNNVEFILRDSRLMTPFDIHPNADGDEELSQKVADAWLTGSCNVEFLEPMATSASPAVTATTFNTMLVAYISNGIHGIYDRPTANGVDIRNSSVLGDIAAGTWFDIFNDTNPLLFTDALSGTCYASIAHSGGSDRVPCEWRYMGNTFSIRMQQNFTGVTIIFLRGVNSSLPTIR